MNYTIPDLFLVICGAVSAIGNGVLFPIFSIYLSKIIAILMAMESGLSNQNEANQQALVFFGIAIGGFFTNFLQNTLFTVVGDRFTKRVRSEIFNKMLKMRVGWFD